MAMATREAYGKTLAKLIVEHDDLFVLDADLTKSTKTIEAKKARPEHHFRLFMHPALRCLRQAELLNRFVTAFVILT